MDGVVQSRHGAVIARPRAAPARPFIVGIGGTVRQHSSSERALRTALSAAAAAGAETVAFTGEELMLPMYAPEQGQRTPTALRLVEAIRRCDGLIIASPGYHGGLSGLVKNALDYVEDLRDDPRPYLEGRAVGCIVCASGWQAVGTTLTALRSIVHSLRGWPTPLGAGLNTAAADPAARDVAGETSSRQLESVGRHVVDFARRQMLG